jgi:hypothetical protein
VIPDYGIPAKSILAVGDSVDAHSYPQTSDMGLAQIASMNERAAGRFLGVVNMAHDGQKHAESMALARSMLAQGLRPTYALMTPWSVNSGVDQVVFDACWNDTINTVLACNAAGVQAMVRTIPAQGTNIEINARIEAQNVRVRGLAGITVLDIAPGWNVDIDNFDTNHMTDAGRNKAAAKLQTVI